MAENFYSEFTNLFSVTKSIQFKLEPYGATRDTIKSAGLLKADEKFREDVDKARPVIDACIRDKVICPALSLQDESLTDDFRRFGEILDTEYETKYEKDRAVAEISQSIADKIRKNVSKVLPKGLTVASLEQKPGFEFITQHAQETGMDSAVIDNLGGKLAIVSKLMKSRIVAINTLMPKRVTENFIRFHENKDLVLAAMESPVGEKVSGLIAPEMLSDETYPDYLTQSAIDGYNLAVLGTSDEDGYLQKGLNSYINEYNQSIRKKKDVRSLRKIRPLDKQILSISEPKYTIYKLEEDSEIIDLFYQMETVRETSLYSVCEALGKAAPEEVLIAGDKLHLLSYIIYKNHRKILNAIVEAEERKLLADLENVHKKADHKKVMSQIDKLPDNLGKKGRFYSFDDLNTYMDEDIFSLFISELSDRCRLLERAAGDCEGMLRTGAPVRGNKAAKLIVKRYFEDCWTAVRESIRLLSSSAAENRNNSFYDIYDENYNDINRTYKQLAIVKAYLTRKTADTVESNEAFLGFANRFTNCWYSGGEMKKSNNALLMMDGAYYFLTLPSDGKKLVLEGNDPDCKVLAYSKAQPPHQFLPLCTFSKRTTKKNIGTGDFFMTNPEENEFMITEKVTEPVRITRDAYEAYVSKEYSKEFLNKALKSNDYTQEQKEQALHSHKESLRLVIGTLIDFVTHYEPWSNRTFNIKPAEDYDSLHDFYKDLEPGLVNREWLPADKAGILNAVKEGRLLMFRITNRDLEKYYRSHDKADVKNEYTKMFLCIMDGSASGKGAVRLNSRPKLRYRTATTDQMVVHRKGDILVGKRDVNGDRIPSDIYIEIRNCLNKTDGTTMDNISKEALSYINNKRVKTRIAAYDIIKDRRYRSDQFSILLSYTKNPESSDAGKNPGPILNRMTAEHAQGCNRIVLARGLEDALYMLIADPEGNVLEEQSLNVVDNIDYAKLLMDIEADIRSSKREEWEFGTKIENVRSGYFAKAISVIVRKAVEYKAIIVLEKVAERSKDRGLILGNTAYKRFETLLQDRLSDLHFTDIPDGEPGSATNPYQLCAPATDRGNGYRNGIVFFVPSWGAKKSDPETGFKYGFDIEGIQTKAAKNRWLSLFDEIVYDPSAHAFRVKFDYGKFKTYNYITNREWDLVLSSRRGHFSKKTNSYVYIERPFDEIAEELRKAGIDPETDILEALSNNQLNSDLVNILFISILEAMEGVIPSHDGKRAEYVSPVTGRRDDYSRNCARNLLNNLAC